MDTAVDYAKIEEHPAETARLFKVMMRLEFGLKEIGCCRAGGDQKVEVDWDRLANECLGRSFFDAVKAEGNADVLLKAPPQHQIINDEGFLSWEQAGAVSNIRELIGAVRRVRNNLFHGGKHGDPDKDRNDSLICNALAVVDAMLQHDDDLRMMFEGKY